eukprot:symbB.v1.2.021843.t1/scaffold1911.1/size96319/12
MWHVLPWVQCSHWPSPDQPGVLASFSFISLWFNKPRLMPLPCNQLQSQLHGGWVKFPSWQQLGRGPQQRNVAVFATQRAYTQLHEGTVKSYNKEKGFGFIECPTTFSLFKRDVFLHRQQAEGLEVGDCVNFEVQMNAQGNPQARNVKRILPAQLGLGKDAIEDAWAAVDADDDPWAAVEADKTAAGEAESDPFADAWAMVEAEKEVQQEEAQQEVPDSSQDDAEAQFLGQVLGDMAWK